MLCIVCYQFSRDYKLQTSRAHHVLVGLLNGVGNILPFGEEDFEITTTTVAPPTTRRPPTTTTTRLVLDADYNYNNTNGTHIPTCCENVTAGLCDWIEPVGWMCVEEDDRKSSVWSEKECLLIYPDDIKTYTDRYNAYKAELERQSNELVSSKNFYRVINTRSPAKTSRGTWRTVG